MATCKDCEYYEFYDGPKLTETGKKAIMRCTHEEIEFTGLCASVQKCDEFTPRSPKSRRRLKNLITVLQNALVPR